MADQKRPVVSDDDIETVWRRNGMHSTPATQDDVDGGDATDGTDKGDGGESDADGQDAS